MSVLAAVRRANAAVWRVVDWRYIASLAAAGLVAVVVATLITSDDARQDAVDARDATARAATRRIDILNDRQERVEALLVAAEVDRAELKLAVQILTEQIRRDGGDPIIVVPAATDGRGADGPNTPTVPPDDAATPTDPGEQPQPPTATSPPPADPPQDTPRPATPIPFPCSTVFVPVLCTQGAAP